MLGDYITDNTVIYKQIADCLKINYTYVQY